MTDYVQVDVSEFQANLSKYLDAGEPLEVVRQGEIIGKYVPQRKTNWQPPSEDAFERYRTSHEALMQALEADGFTEEDLEVELERIDNERKMLRR